MLFSHKESFFCKIDEVESILDHAVRGVERCFLITNLRKNGLQNCAVQKLQSCAKRITNLRRDYKIAQKGLQSCAGITKMRKITKLRTTPSFKNSYHYV